MRRRVWALVGLLVLAGVLAVVPAGSAVAGDERGAVGDVVVVASVPGVLSVSWSAPSEPVGVSPSDYRVRWAAVGDPWLTWSDLSGNAFPVATSFDIGDLTVGVAYRVQVRARYSGGSSGPWSDTVTAVAVAGGVDSRDEGDDAEGEGSGEGEDVSELGVGFDAVMGVGTWSYGGGAAYGYKFWGGVAGSFEIGDGAQDWMVGGSGHVRGVARMPGERVLPVVGAVSDSVVLVHVYAIDSPFVLTVDGRLFASTRAVVPSGSPSPAAHFWVWDSQCAGWSTGDQVAVALETVPDDDPRLAAQNDTTLASLTVDGATLSESFDAATYSYTATTGADTETVTIEATAADASACDVVIVPADADPDTDGHQVTVAAPGDGDTSATTDVTVTVTGADNAAVGVYQVAVQRPAALSDDAALATLEITDSDDAVALLTPAFDTATTAYAAQAAADVEQVTVTATTADADATVEIAPADADTDTDGHQVALVAAVDGETAATTDITVTVTAADRTTTRAYAVAVSRSAQTRAAAASAGLDAAPGWVFDPDTKRYRVTQQPGASSGRLTMTPASGSDLEAFTVDATLRTRQIRARGTTRLSPTADTMLFIRASDGPRETLYTVRLRPPATNQRTTTANQRTAAKNKGGGWGVTARNGTDPELSALTVSPGTLAPAFAAATLAYEVEVDHNVEHLTATPTAAGSATFTITPTDADPNTPGHQVALNAAVPGGEPAETAIAIVVSDGTNMATYTITAKRNPPPAIDPITFELPEHCTLHDLGAGNWTPWRKYDNNSGDVGFCAQTHAGRPHRSAEYYRLLVSDTGVVTIRTDNHPSAALVVISADGEVIASDRRGFTTNQNYKPSLTLTLDRGAYVIEVGNKLHKGPNHDDNHRVGYWSDNIVRGEGYRLSSLAISSVDMDDFEPTVHEYARRVAADVSRVTVTPTASTADAVVEISPADADTGTDGHQVDLVSGGDTEITVKVAPPGLAGAWYVYRVTVTQVPGTTSPLSTDATLSSLSLGSIDMGTFASTDLDYRYSLGFYESLSGVTAKLAFATTHSAATWTTSPPDADPDTDGHQVAIHGYETVTVTVTAQDGLHQKQYTIRPSRAFPTASTEDCDLCEPGSFPAAGGLGYIDGKFLTVSGTTFEFYDADSGERVEQFSIALPPNSWARKVLSFWTDGDTLWVLFDQNDYGFHYRIYAYSLETKQRLSDKTIHIEKSYCHWVSPLYLAIWSDGKTMYVVDATGKLTSFDIATRTKLGTTLLQGAPWEIWSNDKKALWSDGKTIWTVGGWWVNAFDLQTGASVPGLDLGSSPGGGLWSDGHTMWAAHRGKNSLVPYAIPENARLKTLSVSDGDIGIFNNGVFDYEAEVPAGTTTTTVSAQAAFTGGSSSVAFSTTDADTNADGHQVTLTAGQDNVVTITVTAPNGTDTDTYTLTITHAAS